MVEPRVRPAAGPDAPYLEELERRARQGLDGQRGAARLLQEEPAVAEGWATRLGSPGWWIAVGTIDDVIVAYIAMHIRAEDRVATITQVWVEPDARGVGFGDAMLGEAIDVARGASAAVIEATALPGDRETKNLYERAGLTARKITVSKVL